MLDWLIIGGGLHGSHIARRLMAVCPDAEIAVLDPAASALSHWQRRADACGMTFLRSSQAHHLGLRSDALRRFARQHGFDGRHAMGRYRRPSRTLFEAHARVVTAPVARIAEHALAVERQNDSWRVVTREGGSHASRHVVLAHGPTAPMHPRWGKELPHVLDHDFAARYAAWPGRQHIVVIGGGLSAAQRAIACARDGHAVTLLSRHRLRQAAFDSKPCFSGPRCMEPFLRLPPADRPAALAAARNPGTLPADAYIELATLFAANTLRWLQGEAASLRDDGLALTDKRRIRVDRIILATGFMDGPDALSWRVADQLRLPLDGHGYARIDRQLSWAPGLHVAGRPASLQLGPMAGNIRGARLAARRLAGIAGAENVRPASAAMP